MKTQATKPVDHGAIFDKAWAGGIDHGYESGFAEGYERGFEAARRYDADLVAAKAVFTLRFTDAQEMARLHPKTFEAPSQAELDAIKPGDRVQACFNEAERMWVVVSGVYGDEITGELANQPMTTENATLQLGDVVALEKRHVYAILDRKIRASFG